MKPQWRGWAMPDAAAAAANATTDRVQPLTPSFRGGRLCPSPSGRGDDVVSSPMGRGWRVSAG